MLALGAFSVGVPHLSVDTKLITHTSLAPPPLPYAIPGYANGTLTSGVGGPALAPLTHGDGNGTMGNNTNGTMACLSACDGLMCDERYAPSVNTDSCQCECVSNSHMLPQNGRVALLLRGKAFQDQGVDKEKRIPCLPEAKDRQLNAARSLLEHIVDPLEARNNIVEIIVSEDGNSCGLDGELLDTYARRRIKSEDITNTFGGQSKSLRHVLDLFKMYMINRQEPGNMNGTYDERMVPYDLVLVARHDMHWKTTIDSWTPPADFNMFNFLSRCEESHPHGSACVNDAFYMMPGKLFGKFDDAVGKGNCFANPKTKDPLHQNGQLCYGEIVSRIQSEVSYITNWRPANNIHEKGCPVVEIS